MGNGRQVKVHFVPEGESLEPEKVSHALGLDEGADGPRGNGNQPWPDLVPVGLDGGVTNNVQGLRSARQFDFHQVTNPAEVQHIYY